MTGEAAPPRASDGLALRVVSAVVLAPLAVGIAYLGGWPFVVFWAIAAIVILSEWVAIVRSSGTVPSARRATWYAAGVVYAGAMLVACVLLRRDADYGFLAIVLLFGVVWATDILGYFVGRAIGGPRLWPAVSPKKTWSGALGGAAGAIAAALAIASYAYRANPLAITGLALLLSAVSQGGDLLESAVKRRFGVKDAGHIIPGHGGVMDRLDGFLAAAVVAAIIGVARGGIDAARGLLVW